MPELLRRGVGGWGGGRVLIGPEGTRNNKVN